MGTGHVVGVASHEYHGADTNGAKHGDRAPWLQYDCGRRGGLGPTSLGSTSPTAGRTGQPALPAAPDGPGDPRKRKLRNEPNLNQAGIEKWEKRTQKRSQFH